MIRMDLADVFATAADRFLRSEAAVGENEALLLSARLSFSARGQFKTASQDRHVHFMLSGRGYVRVMYAESERAAPTAEKLNALDWKETSYHDSGWREDGIRTPLGQLADRISAALRHKCSDQSARVSCRVWPGDGAQIGQIVPVTLTDNTERHLREPVIAETGWRAPWVKP